MQAIASVNNIKNEEETNWQTKIKRFLITGKLSEDRKKARIIQIKATRHIIMDKKLYRKSWDMPFLKRCMIEEEGQEVMRQIHEGVCGNHTRGRNLAHKAMS